jgi:hypothetical protein
MTHEESAQTTYRVVCPTCDMRTGKMPREMAERGRDAHEDGTGHDTHLEEADTDE